jgi:uncharacterized lipoprotein YajG
MSARTPGRRPTVGFRFMKNIARLGLIAALPVFAACTQVHSVAVVPELFVSPSQVGDGKTVGVRVVDRRASKIIGQGTGQLVMFRKYKIEPRPGLTATLEETAREGLRKLGFRPKAFNQEESRRLSVELLALRNTYTEKGTGFEEVMKVALKAHCRAKGGDYANEFRVTKEEEHPMVLTNFPNEELINLTVSLAFQRMFQDEQLLACLAR